MPNRLRLTRVLRGIGQLELYKKSGVWPSRISGYERGYFELSKDEKRRLAKALKVSVRELFPRDQTNMSAAMDRSLESSILSCSTKKA